MSQRLAEFEYDGIRVLGTSLAGEETVLVLPEFRVAFDVGRAPRDVINADFLFLTHGHMDHAAGVAYYFSQRMFVDLPPPRLYAPAGLVEPLRELLRLWGDIDGAVPAGEILPATPDQEIEVRRGLYVRPFQVCHPGRGRNRARIDALGYVLVEVRQKLKPEYAGLTGPQIVQLKSQGVEITRRLEVPLVACCGDTAPGPFLDRPDVRSARVLLLECTFLDPDHRDRARAGNHMHLDDLREVVPRLQNERILLTHLTRRTLAGEIRERLTAAFGTEYGERITTLMEHRRRRRTPGPNADGGENA